jgi:hypothetical protein
MKKISIASFLALAVFAFSCKKDKDKSVLDMLQGKWYMTDSHYDLYFNGNHISDSATYYKGEYTAEFKGNLVIGESSSGSNTTSFTVIDGPKLVTSDGDTSEITKLTDTLLSLYTIDRSIPGNTAERSENFKRY